MSGITVSVVRDELVDKLEMAFLIYAKEMFFKSSIFRFISLSGKTSFSETTSQHTFSILFS
jgi:hypothetical protein